MKINEMENQLENTDFTKKKVVKWGLMFVGILLIMGVIGFGFDILNIQKKRITEPMKENVRREVFENTQSYVHGKRQELAKAYGEWSKTEDVTKKSAIEEVIKVTFSDFPANEINNDNLRKWLVSTRGY
jgi:hypothetical protein